MALRDVQESDLEIFFEHQREPEANRIAAFPARERDAFFAHWHKNILGNPNALMKAITLGDAVAGNIGSWSQNGKRLVGFWIGSKYWRRGIATAALAEFIATHEPERPLFAYVAVQNLGSLRTLEKCGFRRVGEPVVGDDGLAEFLMELNHAHHG